MLNVSPIQNRYINNAIDGVHQEENSSTYYNWITDKSFIKFPLRVSSGDVRATLREKRHIKQQAYLFVFANGNRVFMKNIQGKDYEKPSFGIPIEYIKNKDLELKFRILSNEVQRKKGMRLDWIKLTVSSDARIIPTKEQNSEFILFLILNTLLFSYLMISGRYRLLFASFPVLLFLIGNTFFRVETSHLIYHINRWVYLPALILTLGFYLYDYLTTKRIFSTGRFFALDMITVPLLFYVSLLVRICGTFYYQFYYPDVRSYFKYMLQLDERGLIGFAHWYGHHHLEILYGFRTPFPYSPLFHLTAQKLNFLGLDYIVWLRVLSMLYNTVLVILVYVFIRKLFRDYMPALFGTFFFMFGSLVFDRIYLSMYAGLFSTLVVFSAMILLLYKINEFNKIRIRWLILIMLSLAFLSYPSGFVNLLFFFITVTAVLLVKKTGNKKVISINNYPETKPLVKTFLLALGVSFFIYYIYFLKPIFTELLPFLAKNGSSIHWEAGTDVGFLTYLLQRVEFYLSIPGILLVIPGLYLLSGFKLDEFKRKFIKAWFITWFLIYILAAPQLLSFVFRLGKEGLFILPLFSAAAGLTLTWLWKRGKIGRFSAILVLFIYIGHNMIEWFDKIRNFMVFVE